MEPTSHRKISYQTATTHQKLIHDHYRHLPIIVAYINSLRQGLNLVFFQIRITLVSYIFILNLSAGIGPKRAIELIKQHKSIEEIVKHIDTKVIL